MGGNVGVEHVSRVENGSKVKHGLKMILENEQKTNVRPDSDITCFEQ